MKISDLEDGKWYLIRYCGVICIAQAHFVYRYDRIRVRCKLRVTYDTNTCKPRIISLEKSSDYEYKTLQMIGPLKSGKPSDIKELYPEEFL